MEDALIDTGATFTVIPPEVSEFLELDVAPGRARVGLVTASGFIEAPVRILDAIEIGGFRVELLPVVIHMIPDPAPIKVLIGMNLVQRAKLEVDGKAGTFSLVDP